MNLFSKRSRRSLVATQSGIQWVPKLVARGKAVRGVKLVIHVNLVRKLRMWGAVPPLFLYAFYAVDSKPLSLHSRVNKPTWCHLLFYFTSYVLNTFRTLIYPSSGACDYSVELPYWSYCSWFDVCWGFGVAGLGWYPCCRLKQVTSSWSFILQLSQRCTVQ